MARASISLKCYVCYLDSHAAPIALQKASIIIATNMSLLWSFKIFLYPMHHKIFRTEYTERTEKNENKKTRFRTGGMNLLKKLLAYRIY